jgi:hypothetical protein
MSDWLLLTRIGDGPTGVPLGVQAFRASWIIAARELEAAGVRATIITLVGGATVLVAEPWDYVMGYLDPDDTNGSNPTLLDPP